jgi:hypothetical protein
MTSISTLSYATLLHTYKIHVSFLIGVPIITIHPSPARTIISAGEITTFRCASVGNPRPWITWTLRGEDVLADGSLISVTSESPDQYSTESHLIIGPAESNVTGTLQCHTHGNSHDGELVVLDSNTSQLIFHCKFSQQTGVVANPHCSS